MKTKKIFALLLCALLLLCAACGNSEAEGENETPLEPENTPVDSEAVSEALWNDIQGYWVGEDGYFIGIYEENGVKNLVDGIINSDFLSAGEIRAEGEADGCKTLELYFPATPATDMDDAREALELTIALDLSERLNGVLKIKIGENWSSYRYGGKTLGDLQ